MKILFWKVARAYSMTDFNDAMAELKKASEAAAAGFQAYNPNLFCRAFMNTTTKSDVITSNMAETFNGYIIKARTKHILYMLEEIRAATMRRLVAKRREVEKCVGNVCPRVQAKLHKEKLEAADYEVLPSTAIVFQINHNLGSFVVNLEEMSCTCRKWDMTGIPCSHACAAIFFSCKEPEAFVHHTLTKEFYLKAYSGSIPPIEGERHWPRVEFNLDPPPIMIGPGRPKKNRRKDPHESPRRPGKLTRHGIEMTCSICLTKGHNKRKCPDKDKVVAQEPPKKRGRGRPRLDGREPQPRTDTTSLNNITVQPSMVGRGGRVIRGGSSGGGRGNTGIDGSSGGGRGNIGLGGTRGRGNNSVGGSNGGVVRGGNGSFGRGSRGGRGSTRANVPEGLGVINTPDGTTYINPHYRGGSKVIGESSTSVRSFPQQSQFTSMNEMQINKIIWRS